MVFQEINRLAGYTVVLLVMTIPASAVLARQGRPPTAVRVAAVEMRTIEERREVTGELRVSQRSSVATIDRMSS